MILGEKTKNGRKIVILHNYSSGNSAIFQTIYDECWCPAGENAEKPCNKPNVLEKGYLQKSAFVI